ncbi:MAG: DUF3105 domain-containing protein [Chloroflexota bacterium]
MAEKQDSQDRRLSQGKKRQLEQARQQLSQREKRRLEHARQQRQRRLLMGGAAVLLVAIVALAVVSSLEQNIQGVVKSSGQSGGQHDDEVVYAASETPPTGGVHSPRWQNCGIYADPIETKYAVHSLEHGAIWLTYRPDLAADDVATLQSLVRAESRGHLLLSPFEGQVSPLVLTAWERQLTLDSVTDERIVKFIDAYQGRGEAPEPGASCTDGVGTPIS